ncbi:hypothetical protein LCGC14_2331110, partial [marine sediment metagenome]
MFRFVKFLIVKKLNNKGETLNNMAYSSGAGELQNAVPTYWADRLRDDAINRAFWG